MLDPADLSRQENDMEIRDDVHQDVTLREWERHAIDTPEFQRLRRVYQLPTVQYVFPGATHTRFGQAIGTLEIASKIADSITLDRPLKDEEKKYLRLAALLADIQDPPFYTVFYEDYKNEKIVDKVLSEIRADRISKICERVNAKSKEGIDYKLLMDVLTAKLGNKYHFIRQIIESEVGADRIDYLVRDSYYCGVHYGNVDERIFTMFKLEENELVLKREALSLADDIIHSLFAMRYNVYDHKVCRAVTRMVKETYSDLIETRKRGREKVIKAFAQMDDFEFLDSLMEFEKDRTQKYVTRLVKERDLIKTAFMLEAPALKDITLVQRFDELRYDGDRVEEELQKNYGIRMFVDFVPTKPPSTAHLQVRINGGKVPLRNSPLLRQWYGKSGELGQGEGALSKWKMFIFSEETDRDEVKDHVKELFEPFLLGSQTAPKKKLKIMNKLYSQLDSLQKESVKDRLKYELMSLHSSKRKTLVALLGASDLYTPEDIKGVTGRSIAAENIILNEMTKLGFVQRNRLGHSYGYALSSGVEKALQELKEDELL